MATLPNRSSAGESIRFGFRGNASAAAVWEPSGLVEGTAAERQVRTLRPVYRTQVRPVGGGAASAVDPAEQGEGRQETCLSYLLGALLGLAVVSAALVGPEGDGAPPVPGPATVAERLVVPANS